jgi:hypothetical protein
MASPIFYLWPGSAGTPQAFAQKHARQEDMPASAAASLSLNLLSSPAGSAYRGTFPGPPADGASSVESPHPIASTPIPPATGAIAAPGGGGKAMIESKGQLRTPSGGSETTSPRRARWVPRLTFSHHQDDAAGASVVQLTHRSSSKRAVWGRALLDPEVTRA